MSVRLALDEFMSDTRKAYPDLEVAYDADWRSPCEIGAPYESDGEQRICWQPVPRDAGTAASDFAPLERALEITVHPDIKEFYASYWSAGLEAEAVDGHVSLLFLWNPDDVERLNENLIGHALSRQKWARKKKARQESLSSMSVFFACTEPDSELFLSVDNDSGAVLLEKPGQKPIRQVAPDLAGFIKTLVPRPPALHR